MRKKGQDKKMSLGERIYQYRKAKGMSQDALAELLDVSRQSVSKWENDTAQPELSKLTIMCDLFGVSLDELARGKQPQPAAQPESQESQGSQESQASPESETSLHATKRTKSLQRTLGIGLLLLSAFQMTLLLVLRFQADEILILLLPLLLCGSICLVCKKHTFLWIGWVISLFLALSPYYFFWVHVNYFSWIAVFIWAFVTVGYIIWQGTAEKRRRERY